MIAPNRLAIVGVSAAAKSLNGEPQYGKVEE
jgi:hypothetical protein